MSDDLNDEQILLASAYLDGDVTSAERAQVEADPQLLAEVERLRAVRTSLAATATTPISTRERHLAAALDAWERLSDAERSGDNSAGIPAVATDPAAAAGAATVTAPTPLAERRNRRPGNTSSGSKTSGWLLTAAAAVLIIAGGGLIARGIIDSGSDDAGNSATDRPAQREELSDAAADEAFADEPAEESAEVAAELAPQVESAIGSTEGRPDDVVTIDSPETLAEFAEQQLALEEVAADAPVTPSESFAADAAVDAAPADADDAAAEESGASETVPARTEADATSTADLTCGLVDRIIAEAEYGTGMFPDVVAIGVDANETEVIAYRVDTCEIVARAPLGN